MGQLGAAACELNASDEHHRAACDEVVVALRDGDIGHPLGDLRWRLSTLLEEGAATLVVDVSQVARLSSTTIAVLLWVKRRCGVRGVRVVLRGPSRRSVDALRRSGLVEALAMESVESPPTSGTTSVRRASP
jgi:anti-anti-sigma regulatory factor